MFTLYDTLIANSALEKTSVLSCSIFQISELAYNYKLTSYNSILRKQNYKKKNWETMSSLTNDKRETTSTKWPKAAVASSVVLGVILLGTIITLIAVAVSKYNCTVTINDCNRLLLDDDKIVSNEESTSATPELSSNAVVAHDALASQNVVGQHLFKHHLSGIDEVGECLSIYQHMRHDDVVLELGGNIGHTTETIARRVLVDDGGGGRVVTVEPGYGNVLELKKLSDALLFSNTTRERIEIVHGVIVPSQPETGEPMYLLDCLPRTIMPGDYVVCNKTEEETKTANYTVREISSQFGADFTAAVIDMEGGYEDGLLVEIANLPTMRLISVEWDGRVMRQELQDLGYVLVDSKAHGMLGPTAIETFVRSG
jgi:hypothetical protein